MRNYLPFLTVLFLFLSFSKISNSQCLTIECRADTILYETGSCSVNFSYEVPFGYDPCAPQFIFSHCGAEGQNGPTQFQVDSAYAATSLAGTVTATGGIQYWRVPTTAVYTIEAIGAKGFGPNAGRGASMKGEFNLVAGQLLKILVGQEGGTPIGSVNQYGGGGGSFVTDSLNNPLIVAGGGGGSWAQTQTTLSDASTGLNGNSGANGPTNGAGGVGGLGGADGASACGGAGITGNGGGTAGGMSFVNGGVGGANRGQGGFGGGGGTSSWDNRRSGGGGGYSGGGGAGSTTTGFPEGGGGGSFNSGNNQVNTTGVGESHGQVLITLPSAPITTTQISGLLPDSAFPIGATTQTFVTTDGTQTLSCSFTVFVVDPTPPTILFPFSSNTICSTSDPIPLPVGKPVGGTYSGTGVVGGTFDPSVSGVGTFWVYYTDNFHCPITDSVSITVEECVGIESQGNDNSVVIAPNPSNGIFNITNNNTGIMNAQVFNGVGELVFEIQNQQGNLRLDLSDQPNGIYIMTVSTEDKLSTHRLMKN